MPLKNAFDTPSCRRAAAVIEVREITSFVADSSRSRRLLVVDVFYIRCVEIPGERLVFKPSTGNANKYFRA
jgi:hypothetical protein